MRLLNASCRLIFLLCFSGLAFADPASSLMQRLATLTSYKASFTQVIQSSSGNLLQKSSGQVAIRRPGYFRWQVDAPMQQVSVSNGKKVWVYEPDLAQVTIRLLDANLAKAPFLLVAQQPKALDSDYRITQFSKNGLAWFNLSPKSSDSTFKTLMLGFDGKKLVGIRLLNALEQTIIINFSDISENTDLSPSLFKINWPKDTDIVDMTQ